MATSSPRSGPHPFKDESRGERLQKVIAAAGFASRRAAEELIEGGLVKVNGILVDSLPAWVDPKRDEVEVDSRPLRRVSRMIYVMLFKPKGVVTTLSDPEGRPTVQDVVKHPSGLRLYPVGRLDMDSSGLLLMTNDGELADRLTHPRYEMHKGYEVTVAGYVGDADLRRIEGGMFLSEKPLKAFRDRPDTGESPNSEASRPAQRRAQTGVLELRERDRDRTQLYMELREGRNRQIRRMLLAVGHPVKKLRRVSMGPLRLRGVSPGEWRELTTAELTALRRDAFADAGTIARRRDRAEQQAKKKREAAKSVAAATAPGAASAGTAPAPARAEVLDTVPTTGRGKARAMRRGAELSAKGITAKTPTRRREIVAWGKKDGPRGDGRGLKTDRRGPRDGAPDTDTRHPRDARDSRGSFGPRAGFGERPDRESFGGSRGGPRSGPRSDSRGGPRSGPRSDSRGGPRAPFGSRDSRGPRGADGPRGAGGPRGPRGPRGSDGPRGGSSGASRGGPRASFGARDSRGPRGTGGPRGPGGPRGTGGPRGPGGPRGAGGPRGPRGTGGPRGPRR